MKRSDGCHGLARNNEGARIKGYCANSSKMPNLDPHKITEKEWKEIVALPAVREAWGLEDDVDSSEFASRVYGVRFNFVSGGPGYVGDLYILQGDALSEARPMVLRRDHQDHLMVCEPEA